LIRTGDLFVFFGMFHFGSLSLERLFASRKRSAIRIARIYSSEREERKSVYIRFEEKGKELVFY